MKPQLVVVLAILATLSVITVPIFKTNSQALTDMESNEALRLVRLVATTEAEMKSTDNSFATLQELMTHGAMKARLQEISMVDSHTGTSRLHTDANTFCGRAALSVIGGSEIRMRIYAVYE
jgi:hypothetical protein